MKISVKAKVNDCKIKWPSEDYIDEYEKYNFGVRIDIWTHFMRGCIIDYVH